MFNSANAHYVQIYCKGWLVLTEAKTHTHADSRVQCLCAQTLSFIDLNIEYENTFSATFPTTTTTDLFFLILNWNRTTHNINTTTTTHTTNNSNKNKNKIKTLLTKILSCWSRLLLHHSRLNSFVIIQLVAQLP